MTADENMPFSSHLDELRKRLIWSLLGLLVVFSLVFAFLADDIVKYIMDIAVIRRTVDGEVTYHKIKFSVINPMETFGTTMRVSLYAAVAFAYPWMMFQAYRFIAPGLYRHERRFFVVAIPAIFVLFFAGAAFGRYILLPITIPFLLDFNVENFEVEQHYTLGQYLALVFAMTFGLGFVFQIPLIVAPLIRFGLLTPEFFKTKRRYTIFIAAVIGALISPTMSPLDMLLAGLPVFFLVEGGVWIGNVWKKMALKSAQRQALKAAQRGEKIDPEELAGGLARDLEQRLHELSKGGARDFARELMKGLRESSSDVESIFDDDYADDEKPPTEVRLKPRKPKPKPAPPPEPTNLKPDQMHNVQMRIPKEGGVFADKAEEKDTPDPDDKPEDKSDAKPDEDWPDRPWDENVTEGQAQYIDDRINQRVNQLMDEELRPWMDRIEHELKRLNKLKDEKPDTEPDSSEDTGEDS
jgi:sec-independent protein translocase protein TatC